jgi:photosystem II stability/assembly factor-like uncharacterized protein
MRRARLMGGGILAFAAAFGAWLEAESRREMAPVSPVVAFAAAASQPATQPAPASVAAAPAGGYSDTFLGGLRWRSIGPARGGRSTGAAGSDARPLEYYFGTTGGGLWKTTNGGTTWTPIADKTLKTSSVGAVAIAPSNPDVVYAGMGESQLRGNIIQGDGVYKTADGGKTWAHVGLEKTMVVSRIRVHPTNPDVVFAAALGNPYASTPDRGVFRSRDGGKTWDRVLFRDEKTGAADLVIDPKNPDVLYATLWEVFRTPHSLSSGGPGSGLFKSTDGGATWTEITRKPGLPKGLIGKSGISVSGADSNRVYAIVEAADGGVFSSDNAGETWTQVSTDRRLRQRAFYYTRIYADPKEKDTLYVLNVGFFRSTDGGKTYRTIRVPHGDNHDLWIAPGDPKRMIEANDGGANVTVDAGVNWTEQDYPTSQFYNVFTTNHVPYHVCGAQQDNSTACVPSTGGGALYPVGGGESGYIAPHPTKLDLFFAGSYGGLMTRFDKATGTSKAINVWPENPMGHSGKDMKERFQWTFPIVFSPHDPNTLYVSSQHLFRTRDEGQSWDRISPDLTRADPETLGPSGGPITLDQTGVETYATIFTVAPSKHDANVIWTGSDDGVVHVTRDGGKNWTKVTPPDLPAFTRISMIEVSPHKPATAYLAGNRYQRGDRAPYVYKTDNYGQSWTKIVTGIPGDDFPRVIREDTERAGLLFVGTEHGIYTSFNDGASWQSLRLELPVTPVHGIVVKDDDLVIGTHGRSFYVLDGINVLRQLQPEVTTASLHVFTPAPAQRRVQQAAPIDYYLKDAAEKVTIEVLDAAGKSVRKFESEPPKKEEKPAAGGAGQPAMVGRGEAGGGGEEGEEEGGGRGGPPARVTTKAGMNRFQWDMRHAPGRDFPGLIMWAAQNRGPVALPGSYQVKVTAGGATQTRPLIVQKDPRTNVSDADLQAQFTLASEIRDKTTAANEAVLRIRHLKAQAKERAEKGKHEKLTAAAEAFQTALTSIEGEIYQYRNQSNQDPLNYPIKLNNKIAALQGIVESADGKPTAQSYEVFKELSARLEAQFAKLAAAVKTDLPALNKLVASRKLAPIKDEVPAAPPTGTAVPSAEDTEGALNGPWQN